MCHSIEAWRTLIRQAWLGGFLVRSISVGCGRNMISTIAYTTYSATDAGNRLLFDEENHNEVLFPGTKKVKETTTKGLLSQRTKRNGVREGKGSHALQIAQDLVSNKENWFPINSSDDYNFPGIFNYPFPQRMGFCEDISNLPNYEVTDPHFIFADIQMGKGKARPKRLVQMDINGIRESVYYRLVPCGGVKRCGKHMEGCTYVAPTSATKTCPQHPDSPLERSQQCPVDFFYIWPEDSTDNRRWLTGIVRSGDLQSNNLHNHPLHSEVKIPVKVDTDIRRAVIENPHLKTSDLIVGRCNIHVYALMYTTCN